MAKMVLCPYCRQKFDREKIPFVMVGARRYAHIECAKAAENNKSQEEKDKEALEEYIMKLFNEDYINARVRKQINQYKEEYNYTYSGMLKALIYFFEIKKNSIEKANGGIGIIPYIYKDAFNYYYAIWEAQQKNEAKLVKLVNPIDEDNTWEIKIPVPQRNIKKRNLFSFLDEENENGK